MSEDEFPSFDSDQAVVPHYALTEGDIEAIQRDAYNAGLEKAARVLEAKAEWEESCLKHWTSASTRALAEKIREEKE